MKKSRLIINSILGYIAIGFLIIGYIKSTPVYNFSIIGIEVDTLILIIGTSFTFGYINYLERELKIEKKVLLIGSFIIDVII